MNVKFHCPVDIMIPFPDTQVKAFSCFDYSIEPHNHDFYEINVITSGKGIHRINRNEIQVQRGNVFFIPT